MDNEKYLSGYVDILKNASSELQNNNFTLQANLKFLESALREQGEQTQKYMMMVADYEKEKAEKSDDENETLTQLKADNEKLKKELSEKNDSLSQSQTKLDNIKIELRDEIQRLKNQVEHLNQVNGTLTSAQNENAQLKTENSSLKNEIENLKQTIATKIAANQTPQKTKSFVKQKTLPTQSIEDGGNF